MYHDSLRPSLCLRDRISKEVKKLKMCAICAVLMVCLSSCFTKISDEEKTLYSIIKKHGVLAEKQGFTPFGAGGAVPDKIEQIIVSYRIKRKVELDEARSIFLSLAKMLLEVANKENSLKVHGVVYPFSFDNILLGVSFDDGNDYYCHEPFISHVFNVGKKINYMIFDYKENILVKKESEFLY